MMQLPTLVRLLQIHVTFFAVACGVFAQNQSLQLSELVARNESSRTDATGDYSDWIEIQNTHATTAASLNGWYLTDDSGKPRKWPFPDIEIGPGEFLVITADNDPTKGTLDATFQLDASGEYLALVSPDGKIVDEIAPAYPPQLPDIAWGRISGGTAWEYLQPTPGAANSSTPLAEIPARIWNVTENPLPPAVGDSIPVQAKVAPLREGSSITIVSLFYRINFDDEQMLEMTPASEADVETFVASIPGTAFTAGDMIRWRAEATTSAQLTANEPTFLLPRDSPQYYGTVAQDPDIATKLPVLHWFVERPTRADSRAGTQASVFYHGQFYDNIFCRTRGQSTANWEKPKYKFDFHKNHHFYWSDDFPKSEEFNLNSFLRGYSREPAMFTYLNAAGTRAPQTFYLQVRQNGDYYGLFGFVEQVDKRFLRSAGFDATGALYKAAQVPATMTLNPSATLYEKHLQEDQPYTDIRNLAAGINVRNEERFDFFADNVNIPNYVNVMASMAVPFNHDQLTKNYYLYRDPNRAEWFRFPWDADQAFPTGPKNSQENWTSPLYGDKDHTQELQNNRPNPEWQNHLHANILDNPVTREMYLRRMRTLMDTFLAQDPAEPETVLISGDKGATTAFFQVPSGPTVDDQWYLKDFDHSDWQSGALGFGFETLGQDFADIITTNIRPSDTAAESTSIYLRIPFTITEPEAIAYWALRMKYDDGFVAYINGTEIARANMAPGAPSWNTPASSSHADSKAIVYEEFTLNAFADLLVAGENVLAIQVANTSAGGSDLLVAAELVSGNPDRSGYFDRLFTDIENEITDEAENDRQYWRTRGVNIPTLSSDTRSITSTGGSLERRRQQLFEDYATGPDRLIPDAQPQAVSLEFGRVDANPAGGNQDAEFIELINPNTFAVDISGWRLRGAVDFQLPPGTVIASNTHAATFQNRLYLTPSVLAFRSRPDFPLPDASRFVVGNYSGHISNAGETITLIDPTGIVAASLQTQSMLSDAQRYLRITEIMYHPMEPHGDAEFIELTNLSDNIAIPLAGVHFTAGVDFTFPADAGELAPGQSIVLVEDPMAYESAFGSVATTAVFGKFENGTGLSNSGERIKLEDASGSTIVEITFNDKLPWPPAADGNGGSLQLASPGAPDSPQSWIPLLNATPGTFEFESFPTDVDPDADNDGDGLSALLEFALGTSDSNPSDAHHAITITPGTPPALTIQRSLTAFIDLDVEISTDLQSWRSAGKNLELTDRTTDPSSPVEQWTLSFNSSAVPSTFYLRLKATQTAEIP
ncbi:MAG: lamin tail domain-containing protein [Verrucomicrobiales bacterium]